MSTYLVHYANARHIASAGDHWNRESRTARSTRRTRSRFFGRNGQD